MSTQEQEIIDQNPGTTLTEIRPEPGQKQVNFFPVFPTLMAEVAPGLDAAGMARDAIALAGDTVNYEGGFTTYFSQQDLEGRYGVAELKEAIYNTAMVYADQNKFEVHKEGIDLQLWVSVIRNNGWHGHHRHPKSHLSGTYYVQVPEGASPITFVNPTAIYRMNEPFIRPADFQEFSAPELPIVPKPDTLFMWPSWLEHYVPASQATEVRVAYSFNVVFKEGQQAANG